MRSILLNINKKIFLDSDGNPSEVLISWEDYQQIEEVLGLGLTAEEVEDLRQARSDREAGASSAYVDLDCL